jgi:hypothetical protein
MSMVSVSLQANEDRESNTGCLGVEAFAYISLISRSRVLPVVIGLFFTCITSGRYAYAAVKFDATRAIQIEDSGICDTTTLRPCSQIRDGVTVLSHPQSKMRAPQLMESVNDRPLASCSDLLAHVAQPFRALERGAHARRERDAPASPRPAIDAE